LAVAFYAFLSNFTDFYEIVCVCLSCSRNDLDSQLDPLGLTPGGAQTVILILTMDFFVYKWLLLIIGEIISRD